MPGFVNSLSTTTALVTSNSDVFCEYLDATLYQNQSHDYSVIMTYIYYSYTKSIPLKVV